MSKITLTFLFGLTFLTNEVLCQKVPTRYFGEPILTDTLSTLFIPILYNEEFLSSNKIAFWGDYYANVVAYNFQTDTYIKLFDKDTFIESFRGLFHSFNSRTDTKLKNITSNWVILLVKTIDTNKSGRIDEKDPSVLFAISVDGKTVKQLTFETENVVSFETFDIQGFVLMKIQKDSNNDKSFKTDDKEFYFKKVNLSDLTLGKAIDVK
jgi:hypothetical protein